MPVIEYVRICLDDLLLVMAYTGLDGGGSGVIIEWSGSLFLFPFIILWWH